MEFLDSPSKFVSMPAGRGAGKSLVASLACARHLKRGESGLLIAPTFEDCDVIVNYLVDFLEASHTAYKHNKSKHCISLRNGARLYYRTGETEKGIRGKTNLSFLVLDEAAMVPHEIYVIALACLRGELVRNIKVYCISTPKGRGNWYYDYSISDYTHMIRATTRDNHKLGAEFYEMLRSNYSADFLAQEAEAEWIDLSACNVFDDSEYRALCSVSQSSVGASVIVGIDVATGGDNSSAAVIRGNEIIRIHSRKTTMDIGSLIHLATGALGGLEPNMFVIDTTGVGAFAPSEFRKHWANAEVFGVNFGEKAYKPGYVLRRDEIHFDLKRRIASGLRFGGGVGEEMRRSVQRQLLATEYTIGTKSAFKLLPKKEIKSKIGCSPDELDSLALAASINPESTLMLRREPIPAPVMPITNRRN